MLELYKYRNAISGYSNFSISLRSAKTAVMFTNNSVVCSGDQSFGSAYMFFLSDMNLAPLRGGDLSVSRLRKTEHAADCVEKLEKDI